MGQIVVLARYNPGTVIAASQIGFRCALGVEHPLIISALMVPSPTVRESTSASTLPRAPSSATQQIAILARGTISYSSVMGEKNEYANL
jgi:hypothetical protein